MKKHTFKRIVYAHGGSQTANRLQHGDEFQKSGCFAIQYEHFNTSYQGQQHRAIDLQIGGFKTICPELQQAFEEAEGTPCPVSLMVHADFYKPRTEAD